LTEPITLTNFKNLKVNFHKQDTSANDKLLEGDLNI